jgi:hypothetical protein
MKRTIISALCVIFVSTALLQAQTPAAGTPPPAVAPVTPPPAPALTYDGPKPTAQFEVDGLVGYRIGGGLQNEVTGHDVDFDDTPTYGLSFQIGAVNSDIKIEFMWTRQDTSLDFHGITGLNSVDVGIDEFQLGGIAEMGEDRFREYVAVSVGATHFSSDFGDDTGLSFGFGVGVKYYVASHFVIRGDMRGFCTIVDSDSEFIFHNGVTVATFSGSTIWQGQATLGLGVVF